MKGGHHRQRLEQEFERLQRAAERAGEVALKAKNTADAGSAARAALEEAAFKAAQQEVAAAKQAATAGLEAAAAAEGAKKAAAEIRHYDWLCGVKRSNIGWLFDSDGSDTDNDTDSSASVPPTPLA